MDISSTYLRVSGPELLRSQVPKVKGKTQHLNKDAKWCYMFNRNGQLQIIRKIMDLPIAKLLDLEKNS